MTRRLALLPCVVGVLVAVVVAVGTPMRATYGARTTADEPHYLLTALSLWEDRSLDVSDERAELRYADFHEVLLPLQATVQADGRQVAPHDPLLPAFLAPAMGLGGWVGAKLLMAATAGLLAALAVVVAVRRFAVRPMVAAVTAGLAGASPPLAVYGTQIYPELPAGLVALGGFWWATGALRTRALVGVAAAITALPWLSVKYAPIAGVLAVAAVVRWWRGGQRRAAGLGAVALTLSGLVFLVLHQRWYGGWTAYSAGSHFLDGEFTVVGDDPDYAGRSVRLLGLLVDRHFGLLVWQPAAIAVAAAMVALARRRPTGWAPLVALVVTGWLTATYVALTMHGWWWPGRQIVVVLPLVIVGVAWFADACLPASGRRVLAVLGGLGVLAYVFLLTGVLAGRHTLIYDFERTLDPVVRLLRTVLPDERRGGAGTLLRNLVWGLVLAATMVAAWCGRTAASIRRPVDAPSPPAPAPRHRDPSPV